MVQFVLALLLVGLTPTGSALGDDSSPASPEHRCDLSGLPVCFVENRGQVECNDVAYVVQSRDRILYFTPGGITFSLDAERGSRSERGRRSERWTTTVSFVGADPGVVPRGEDPLPTRFSYFSGARENWETGVPAHGKLVYENLWPGIDLVFSGTAARLKYEYIVRPGADPAGIRLEYRGVSHVSVAADGALRIATPAREIVDGAPIGYQGAGRSRKEIPLRHRVLAASGGAWTCGFDVGAYDANAVLVIDPEMIVHCGYVGGGSNEDGYDVAVDREGCTYIAGHTKSVETYGFPVTVGPDLVHNGNWDAYVAKIDPTGTQLLYCGYIGGAGNDSAFSIEVDESGAAVITGETDSPTGSLPVLVGPDLTYNGNGDAFVAKILPDGSNLVYCGYIGGSERDRGRDIALDASGRAYVSGEAWSDETSFPVSIGPDLTFNGGDRDAFVARVSATGQSLEYCGYIGGADREDGYCVVVDRQNRALVGGRTLSDETTFPVAVGPDLSYNGGYHDGFIARLSPDGVGLEFCGYIGGADEDSVADMAINRAGATLLTGETKSDHRSFPVHRGPDTIQNGKTDAFVAELRADGVGYEYCGYIGGDGTDTAWAIAVDDFGYAYVYGATSSDETTFPVAIGPDITANGGFDAFVARVHFSGVALGYCGFIGGAANDWPGGIAVDHRGDVYLAGTTETDELLGFPVAVGPDLTFNGGIHDAYVAKITPVPRVDIKCNGLDRDVVITSGTKATVTIAIESGQFVGLPADVFVLGRHESSGRQWSCGFNGAPFWKPGAGTAFFSGGIRDFTVTVVDSVIPVGSWSVFIGLETKANGSFDRQWVFNYDLLSIEVVP